MVFIWSNLNNRVFFFVWLLLDHMKINLFLILMLCILYYRVCFIAFYFIVGSNTDSRSKRNGQSHEISHECDLDDWGRTCRVTCSICRKEFKSNSTFLAHVSSPRHRWKQDQMAMTSQINLQSDSTATDEGMCKI